MYETLTQIRVRYAETDQMNVVYYGNYAQGITYKDIEEAGVIMPVVEMHVKYLRPAKYDDLLTVKTTLRQLPPEHRIEFFQEVFNESGRLLTSGRVVLYFLDAATNQKTNIPANLREKLSPFFSG
jgi:acyl-CoA thioester hydrolase